MGVANKIFSNMAIDRTVRIGTAATDSKWLDMRDYENFAAITHAVALTGLGVTVFKILANDQANGGGTDVVIKTHAVGSAPDAVNDSLVLECSAEEIAAAGEGYRFVSATISQANAADACSVTSIRSGGIGQDALTADVVA